MVSMHLFIFLLVTICMVLHLIVQQLFSSNEAVILKVCPGRISC